MATSDILFEPFQLGPHRLKNRLVSLPHGNSYGRDGIPSAALVPYLGRIATTTAGLVIIGATAIHESTYRPPLFSLFDDRAVPRLREMVGAVHAAGSVIVSQLGHSGRMAPPPGAGHVVWAPSPEPPGARGETFAPLGTAELGDVRAAYLGAARRALAAGFDGVEMHAAHGYLMHQFFSPFYNRRTDAYGGPLESRMRLAVEVLTLVREVSAGKLVGMRLAAGDDRPGGLEWPEVLEIAKRIVGLGLVDYISLAVWSRPGRYIKDASFPPGGLRGHSAELRAAVGVPVIVSQRIGTPAVAADILRAGDADLVGLARELVADPEWGSKARARDDATIRPCVLCMENCRRGADAIANGTVTCSVNPTAYGVAPAVPAGRILAKRVTIVGGGPAGCEAALSAAARGARVVLFERDGALGGQARLAGRAPYRSAWLAYADQLAAAIAKVPAIDVRLDSEGGPSAIAETRPDLVVIATGAAMPSIAGADRITTYDLLARETLPAWRSVAVVDAFGRWDALNAAERAIEARMDVTYLTSRERVADQVPDDSREPALDRLRKAGVRCVTGADLASLADRFDAVVVAAELRSEARSSDWDLGPAIVWRIGDCVSPRGLTFATVEGWSVGARLA